MNFTLSNRSVFLVIAVIGSLFYGSTVFYNFSLDDNYIFQQIPDAGTGFLACFKVFNQAFDKVDYRPIAMFTFAIEQWLLGDLYPNVAHGFNVFYYVLLCFSIYLFIKKLPVENAHYLGFFTALIFLAHPVHANVVSNIKSRDTILSLLFSVWSMYFFIVPLKKKYISYALGFLFFAIALICKLDSISLVFIIPISLFFFTKIKVCRILFFGIIIYFFSVLFRDIFISNVVDIKSDEVGTIFMENPIASAWTYSNRIGQSLLTLVYYLKFMIIPKGYYFYFGYDMLPLHGLLHWTSLLSLVVQITILAFAFKLYKKDEKIAAYSILFFYVSLIYCLNLLVPVAGIIADRYAFIASLGFCLFTAWCFLKLIYSEKLKPFFIPAKNNEITKKKKNKVAMSTTTQTNFRLFIPIILFILVSFPFASMRSKAWKNILTLMDTDMPDLKKSYEANRIATTHYLNAARKQTSKDSAETFYAKALVCASDADNLYPNEIFILESKGISYYGLGNTKAALKEFKKAIQLTDSSLVSLDMIGDMLYRDNQINLSSKFYYQTLKLDTVSDIGYYKYISALCSTKRFDDAFKFSDSLITRRPEFSTSYECKGFILLNKRDTAQAAIYYLMAFEKGMKSKNFANLFATYFIQKEDSIGAAPFQKYVGQQR